MSRHIRSNGDSWAIGLALVALPLVVGLHVLLAYKQVGVPSIAMVLCKHDARNGLGFAPHHIQSS